MSAGSGSVRERSRQYWRIRYATALAETAWQLILLGLFIASGFFRTVAQAVAAVAPAYWANLFVFLLVLSAGSYLLTFPLHFFRSFLLEHMFGLSRQSVGDWFRDQAKTVALSGALGVCACAAFYALAGWQPRHWWWMAALLWTVFSLVLARLAPVLIIPLFFTYTPVSDTGLRRRVLALAQKMGVAVLDVYHIDLSRKTLKANAALVGWGKTRRVVLGDTLTDAYTPEEIETILAHEFAHQKLKHLLRLLLANAFAIVACLYLLSITWQAFFARAGIASLRDPAGLVLIAAYLGVFGIAAQPFENFYSRRLESAADRLALSATGKPDAFVSLMEKLAHQNLADRAPAPLAKFFFFDHPPVDERIAMARSHA